MIMGWEDRGRIQTGSLADVIVFDLQRDPGQQNPIDLSDPVARAFVMRAREALHGRWLQWPDREQVESEVLASDNPAIEQLRVLGYIE